MGQGYPLRNFSMTHLQNSLTTSRLYSRLLHYAVRESFLPQDIIRILKRLCKVETTPFDKLYYLAQNCVDHYYMKVIKHLSKYSKETHPIDK